MVEILAKLMIPKMRCLIFQRSLSVTPTYVGLNLNITMPLLEVM